MYTSKQNILDTVSDKVDKGQITTSQANVLMVQMEGVRLVRGRMPADVRKALNEAVKAGQLGHLKREGLKPEAYHHINSRAKALELRERAMRSGLEAMSKICG